MHSDDLYNYDTLHEEYTSIIIVCYKLIATCIYYLCPKTQNLMCQLVPKIMHMHSYSIPLCMHAII